MKHTPGPWKWVVSPKHHSVELSRGSHGDVVMAFRRWGMSGATPAFNVGGVLEYAVDLSRAEARREHHAAWWRVLRHPDADLIAAAPELLEALEAMLKTYAGVPFAQWPAEAHAADAAIRKARGETP